MIPLSDPDLHSWRKPYVNYTLIGLCAIGFLYELGLGPSGRERFFFQYGLIPAALTQGSGASDIPAVATMITSMFLHGSISHFAFNMLFLWVFGDNVEDRYGHVPYLVFYLGTGVIASLAQVYVNPESRIPTIGASGAIAGVLGAYLLLTRSAPSAPW